MRKTMTVFLLAFIAILNVNAQKIYDVYTNNIAGGGGYSNDYIVLTGFSPNQSVAGWSIQYRGSGTTWSKNDLSGNADAQGIYRIWIAPSAAGAPWTPQLVTTTLGAPTNTGNGQVALMNNTTLTTTGTCPSGPNLIDLVGYSGTSNNGQSACSETSSAPVTPNNNQTRRRKGPFPGQDTGNNFDDFEIIAASTPLPVEFTRFTATYKNQQTNLEWTTASEVNSFAFDVERSNDGVNFTTIGQVKAEGRAHDYAFTDESPLSGTNYYRLKQVDFDGQSDYSPVRVVEHKTNHWVRITPNPLPQSQSPQLQLDMETEGTLQVNLYDQLGQLLHSAQIDVVKGNNVFTLDAATELPVGTYSVQVIDGKEAISTQQLIIR